MGTFGHPARKRRPRMKPRHGTALILGASGQDGAYLADLLIQRGLEVHGTSRDREVSSYAGLRRLGIHHRVTLHSAVLGDFRSVVTVLNNVRPAFIFNLAAQSSVGLSFERPVETIDSIMHGTINVMEAMRFLALEAKFYNAASSECFGNTSSERPATETTSFSPRSPYAVGKAASFWAVANYREAYGLFVCNGLLFNHESPLRSPRYVTQKIVRKAVEIAAGRSDIAELGVLTIARDWGWAPEYVDAMARMLDLDAPEDFVIATGETRTLEDFAAAAFACVGRNWRDHVVESPALHRPLDIMYSSGDPSKAARLLGWKAENKMADVVNLLVEAELKRLVDEDSGKPAAAAREAVRRSA
jgi:GDPmannose 4,6-dehydratase